MERLWRMLERNEMQRTTLNEGSNLNMSKYLNPTSMTFWGALSSLVMGIGLLWTKTGPTEEAVMLIVAGVLGIGVRGALTAIEAKLPASVAQAIEDYLNKMDNKAPTSPVAQQAQAIENNIAAKIDTVAAQTPAARL